MNVDAASLIRRARARANLTQKQLAALTGTTQSTIARLERPGSNPRLDTLERMLDATGQRLEIRALKRKLPEVDETQIAARLRLTPAERLATFTRSNRNIRSFLGSIRPVEADGR
jgi:transcriptional regulator with XRE-family HTH domain